MFKVNDIIKDRMKESLTSQLYLIVKTIACGEQIWGSVTTAKNPLRSWSASRFHNEQQRRCNLLVKILMHAWYCVPMFAKVWLLTHKEDRTCNSDLNWSQDRIPGCRQIWISNTLRPRCHLLDWNRTSTGACAVPLYVYHCVSDAY